MVLTARYRVWIEARVDASMSLMRPSQADLDQTAQPYVKMAHSANETLFSPVCVPGYALSDCGLGKLIAGTLRLSTMF